MATNLPKYNLGEAGTYWPSGASVPKDPLKIIKLGPLSDKLPFSIKLNYYYVFLVLNRLSYYEFYLYVRIDYKI